MAGQKPGTIPAGGCFTALTRKLSMLLTGLCGAAQVSLASSGGLPAAPGVIALGSAAFISLLVYCAAGGFR